MNSFSARRSNQSLIDLAYNEVVNDPLIIFFISGALLLTRVDEEEGIRVAKEVDTLAAQEV